MTPKMIVLIFGASSKEEYNRKQLGVGREIPPCVHCPIKDFIECRDNDLECVAFREYIQTAKFKDGNRHRLKRKFRREDHASVRVAA